MKIGLFQYSPEWEDKETNKEKIQEILSQVKSSFDLIVFPEMTLTGFSMKTSLAEPFDINKSPTLKFFNQIARNFKTSIVAGLIEKENDKFFNTLFFIDQNGKSIVKYRKIHLFSFAKEDKFYTSGSEPVILENKNFKIGFSICYDLRFPELFRVYAKLGVELIINIANWPVTRIDHYIHLLKARAIENQCFVVGVNRVGYGGKEFYDGRSSVFDPMGNEIVCVKDEEKLIEVELDLTQIKSVREKFPFLDDIKLI